MLKVIKPTIEAGSPAHLVSFGDEHPEPYSDYQLDQLRRDHLRRERIFEGFGLIGCSIFITLVFVGLVAIL